MSTGVPQELFGPHSRVRGILDRIVYTSAQTHYTVAELKPERPGASPVMITGKLIGVQCGESLDLTGAWVTHPQYGKQFKVESFKAYLPTTLDGMTRYLGSGLIPGIGKKYAQKIVEYFGPDTMQILSEESARLREVPGVGQQRARAIKKAWDNERALRDVMLTLHGYGVGNAMCLRLVKAYGSEAKKILEDEPYRVAREVHGLGFKTADKIALNRGLPHEGAQRLEGGLEFALESLMAEGHSAPPTELLLYKAAELLEVPPLALKDPLDRLATRELVLREGDSVQTIQMHNHEKSIARHIKRIIEGPSGLPPIIIEKAIPWVQSQVQVALAEQQRTALERALSCKVSIITGGPGTGKTTMLKALVKILKAKEVGIILAAPTGRAAQRMHESTGHAAQTIHRLLKYEVGSGRFVHREGNPIQGEFFVVDEASMLDTALAAALLAALPTHAHLVIVGDIYQLPSVGPGQVLSDWIDSQKVPVTRLKAIYRQMAGSAIVSLAHGLLEGHVEPPSTVASLERVDPSKELHFIHAPDGASAQHVLMELCTRYFSQWYPQDYRTGVQILAPMHRGEVGTVALNRRIQNAVNPDGQALPGIALRVGDRVIQTKNLHEKHVFNGDLGTIVNVDLDAATLTADFEREAITFERLELPDLQLAYAISVHKSQGSEFPIVVIPLLKEHYMMLQRNLLYTAITRSRHKVFLVGDPAAYKLAVRKAQASRRHTHLLEKLLKS